MEHHQAGPGIELARIELHGALPFLLHAPRHERHLELAGPLRLVADRVSEPGMVERVAVLELDGTLELADRLLAVVVEGRDAAEIVGGLGVAIIGLLQREELRLRLGMLRGVEELLRALDGLGRRG